MVHWLDIDPDILKRCIDMWGEESQIHMTIEEASELIQVLSRIRFRPKRAPVEEIVSEIADVLLMCHQLAYIYGEELVQDKIYEKQQRVAKKLEHYERQRQQQIREESTSSPN